MDNTMLLSQTGSLIDALKAIRDNGKGIVFIVDKQIKVVGLLTDGDIRGHLLHGHGLEAPVRTLMNTHFAYAKNTDDPAQLIKKTTDEIKVIPIVDDESRYIDFFEFNRNIKIPVASPQLRGRELEYLVDAFLSTWISSAGVYLNKFEEGFAAFIGTKYGVATSNGTTALHLALEALGIGEGDEVIVPDLTFAATINVVLYTKATPVIVDIERDSWCIDPKAIEKAITKKTKAIIPVHLYGQPADMDAIMAIAKKHKLFVIEDAAEAHGAKYKSKTVGSIGDIGCFSFFGNKVITTGEGGMCVTNSQKLAERIRVYKDHGMSKKRRYWHAVVGYNYRMTNLQAAIGLAQLERLDEILVQHAHIEELYRTHLATSPLLEFQRNDLPNRKKITWLVSVLVKNGKRDQLIQVLKSKGIDSRPFFYPLSIMKIYKPYVHSAKISKEIAKNGINFPTTLQVTEDTVQRIRATLGELM